MNARIAEALLFLAAVNIAAMFLLMVMSYVSSVHILSWLDSLDRWWARRECAAAKLQWEKRTALPKNRTIV